ncbi:MULTISPECIES: hypothetical protein [Listeria]|uniref:hypothetical protein n=1 Tax=Listeria TaxID=1637 RepID=UPI000B5961CF|nr:MULTISPECIES: hypothetical protein [Listeria]
MGFSLESIATSFVSQISFVIMIVMCIRAIRAYLREDWGAFFGQLIMGLCCLMIVFFGPQLQNIARSLGGMLFK